MKEFCIEQLRMEAPDLDVLSKVIRLYSFCIEEKNNANRAEDHDLLQVMIQFCYNDNVQVRVSIVHVFERALKACTDSDSKKEIAELLSSVPHILHS